MIKLLLISSSKVREAFELINCIKKQNYYFKNTKSLIAFISRERVFSENITTGILSVKRE